MSCGLANNTVFKVRPVRLIFNPCLGDKNTCRPGLDSLTPLKLANIWHFYPILRHLLCLGQNS